MGGVQNSSGNSKGVGGGYLSGQKIEIPGRRGGGGLWNSLCGGGMDIFWNYTLGCEPCLNMLEHVFENGDFFLHLHVS